MNQLDELRRAQGLLTIAEVMALIRSGNVIYDPFSVLIARGCEIGRDNVLFPCTYLFRSAGCTLTVGDGNVFHTNTVFAAEAGDIRIGSGNQFGEGGFAAKANRDGAGIRIGDGGRYLGGGSAYGNCDFGSGTQILGAITVDNCQLEAGESYRGPDPDSRGGLLKGLGSARGLTVPTGRVIAGNGVFRAEDMQLQSYFHPPG